MKKYLQLKKLLSVVIFFWSMIFLNSVSSQDTSYYQLIKMNISKGNKVNVDSVISFKSTNIPQNQIFCLEEVDGFEWIFVMMPIFLLLLYTWLFSRGLEKEFLKTMLYEVANSQIGPSKFIAFICGMTAIIISLFATTFYAYILVAECNNNLKLDELWKLVIALGIGIVPYGFYLFSKKEERHNYLRGINIEDQNQDVLKSKEDSRK